MTKEDRMYVPQQDNKPRSELKIVDVKQVMIFFNFWKEMENEKPHRHTLNKQMNHSKR